MSKIVINEHVHLEKQNDTETYNLFFDHIPMIYQINDIMYENNKYTVYVPAFNTRIINLDVNIPLFELYNGNYITLTTFYHKSIYCYCFHFNERNLCFNIDNKFYILNILKQSMMCIESDFINMRKISYSSISNKIVIFTEKLSFVIYDIKSNKVICEYTNIIDIILSNDHYAVNYFDKIVIYNYNNEILCSIDCYRSSGFRTYYNKLHFSIHNSENSTHKTFIYCKVKNVFIPIPQNNYYEYKNGYFLLNDIKGYKLRNNLYKINNI